MLQVLSLCFSGSKNKLIEAAVGFALGAVGGCILGATEDPVDKILSAMTSSGFLKPVMEEVRAVGALGLGTLMGATALTTAMTSVIAGVIFAAVTASLFLALRSRSVSHKNSVGLWVSAGIAGTLGTTLSGATFGSAIEWIVKNYGMVGVLGVLSLFTAIKPPLHVLFSVCWNWRETCYNLRSEVRSTEKEHLENIEWQQRKRASVKIEQCILSLEKEGSTRGMEDRTKWLTEQREREEIERRKYDNEGNEMKQKTTQDWIDTVVVKYVEILAFSGIPVTAVTIVTSAFGLFGYGNHYSVFLVLLALVSMITYFLLKAIDFKFWMLAGCMAMFATFVIALLTLHAGQEVVTSAMRMRMAGRNQSRETISTQMDYYSSLEAVNTAFFAAKLCQLGLGATVGGTLVRQAAGEVKVIVGAALVAGGLLAGIEALAPVLGEAGTAGAMLGMVGATGVSVGATVASAGRWSSKPGTLGTIGGLIMGALGMGKWHMVNIGVQVPVAYVFAMINPI